MKSSFDKSIKAVNFTGALLVYPVKNAKEPDSIWQHLHPRSKMIWDWDDNGSKKVHDLWFLMKRLSSCRKIVYSKWYQGRATFFSRSLFAALLRVHGFKQFEPRNQIESHSRHILEALEMDSPLSTRELKVITELQGRMYEGVFQRALKVLFQRFLIVGFGEVDDGAFPSLAIGATRTLYEDLWIDAEALTLEEAEQRIDSLLPKGSKFRRFLDRSIAN